MKTVALIGVGQLGNRHLEGLMKSENDLEIYVVDNNAESIKIAQERHGQIVLNNDKKIIYGQDINCLPNHIDLVIIATGSIPRASITKSLLSHTTVDYIIFEKVLFPRLAEYTEIAGLLSSTGIHAWVNCPRRMYEYYNNLVKILNPPINMEYHGRNWGLCCNSIHFIDIFMKLSLSNVYNIATDRMTLIDCKRHGYVEMTGAIHIVTPNGSRLHLSDEDRGNGQLSITDGIHHIIIDEIRKEILVDGRKSSIVVPYQSSLTNIVVDTIFSTGDSQLTDFQTSVDYHIPFITAMLNEYNKLIGCKSDLCPIT